MTTDPGPLNPPLTPPPEPGQQPPLGSAAPVPPVPPVPPVSPGGAPASAGSGIWVEVDRLGIRRDRGAGWLGGVCAGVAHRWGVDPLLIRALVVALAVIGGFGAVAYVAAWLLLPDTDGRILLREAAHGNATGIALVVLLAVVVLTGLTTNDSTWFGGWMVPLAVLLLFLVLRSSRDQRAQGRPITPPTAPPGVTPHPQSSSSVPTAAATSTRTGDGWAAVAPRPVPPVPAYAVQPARPARPQRRRAPRGTGVVVLGLSVVAYGLGHLLDGAIDFPGTGNLLGLVLALGVASFAALALGLWGRRGGVASALTLLLLLPVAGAVTAQRVDLVRSDSVTWSPSTPTAVRQLGAGTLTVDLSALATSGEAASTISASPSIAARVGAGEIIVQVPAGTELIVHAVVGIGEFSVGSLAAVEGSGGAVGIQVGGDAQGLGVNKTVTVTRPSTDGSALHHISLDANIGVGSITLQEK